MSDTRPVDSGPGHQEVSANLAELGISQNWETVKGRVRREKLEVWTRHRPSEDWRTDEEPAPDPPKYGQPGVVGMGFVDLHAIEPGTLVYFFGHHPAANYVLKGIDQDTLKLWRVGTTGGLVGPVDAIRIFDHGPSYSSATDEGDLYKGALVRRDFQGIEPMIGMPYFEYDQYGKIQKPKGEWMDTVMAIYIKKPGAK